MLLITFWFGANRRLVVFVNALLPDHFDTDATAQVRANRHHPEYRFALKDTTLPADYAL